MVVVLRHYEEMDVLLFSRAKVFCVLAHPDPQDLRTTWVAQSTSLECSYFGCPHTFMKFPLRISGHNVEVAKHDSSTV